jgi:hypothetical protein
VTPDIYVKQGDTLPAVVARLVDGAGDPVDLSGGSVAFSMRRAGVTVVSLASALLLDPRSGLVSYPWGSGNTDGPGRYEAEFKATLGGGGVRTFPSDGYMDVLVTEKVERVSVAEFTAVEDGGLKYQATTGSWEDAQAGPPQQAVVTETTEDAVAFRFFSSLFILSTVHINFDTSSIPDGNEITSARLKLYSSAIGGGVAALSSDTLEVRILNWGNSLEAEDWPGFSGTDWTDLPLVTSAAGGSWTDTDEAENILTWDADLLSQINTSGRTRLALAVASSVDANPSGEGVEIYMSEASAALRPVLEVTHRIS